MASTQVSTGDMGRQLEEQLAVNYSDLFLCADQLRKSEGEQWRNDRIVGTSTGVTGTPTVRVRYGDDSAPLESLGLDNPSLSMLSGAVTIAERGQ